MKIIKFFKHNWNKIISGLCAVCISALCISDFAYASSDQWAALGEDAVALKNAYVNYVKSLSSGSISEVFGSAVDIPTSWLKTMSDGVLAISPVDDLFYFFSDGKLQYEDNRSHRAGGGGGRRRGEATEIKPDVPASTIKNIKDYWSDYYKPHPNSSQYIYSYQTEDSDVPKKTYYYFKPTPPVYINNDWGKKSDWVGGVYVLPFYQDNDNSDGILYSDRYVYFHTSGSVKDGDLKLVMDFYDLSSNKLIEESSFSVDWNIQSYSYVSWDFLNYRTYRPVFFSTRSDYSTFSKGQYATVSSKQDYGSFLGGKYVKYSTLSSLLSSSTFTPDTDEKDDWGYIMSSEPFQLYANEDKVDYSRIPDNYVITVYGDNIYNYDIRDPVTGKHTTINNYITNNYIFPEGSDDGDDSGSGSGGSGSSGGTVSGDVSVGGKVDVSGNVDVSGKIEIDTKPIDININVNNPGSGSGSSGSGGTSGTGESVGDYIDPPDVDSNINNYLAVIPDISKNFCRYLIDFFYFLPSEIYGLIVLGLVIAIFCRIAGR